MLFLYTFFPRLQTPVKDIKRHIPSNMPAADICGAFIELGFNVTSVKQIYTTHKSNSKGEFKSTSLLLSLIFLLRAEMTQKIFKLIGLCHISIKWRHAKARVA
jgi:hypothetical protein